MPTQVVKDKNVAKLAKKVESLTKALQTATAKAQSAEAKRVTTERSLAIATADLAFWQSAPVDGAVTEPEPEPEIVVPDTVESEDVLV